MLSGSSSRIFGDFMIFGVKHKASWLALLLLATVPIVFAGSPTGAAQRQPNILWLVSEDNGPLLGCYGDRFAHTPNLDGLGSQGVVYLNAFANSPGCAPSRSTLITGMYASSLGTQNMRSHYRIPAEVQFYATYMKRAGYYCMNPGKTDYNTARPGRTAWDHGESWKDAPAGKPWMLVLNSMITHESCLTHSVVHPEYLKIPFSVPAYQPDTPEVRSNWIEYYHAVTKMDAWVGDVIRQLQTDGLADDTIVFYFSDQGGILPRSKGFVYDSGLHVPLIVRFGRNFLSQSPGPPGTKLDRVVSLVDLPPTLSSLAGADIPAQYTGAAFLGAKSAPQQQYAFGFRARLDERYDLSYTLRDTRYRYIRNYMPHRIYGQRVESLWQVPAMASWENAYHIGICDGDQSAFWNEKPTEELYDEQADPAEVKNLAGYPTARNDLVRMRKALREQLLSNRDSGLFPEPEMLARFRGDAVYSITHTPGVYPLESILDAADLASGRDSESVPRLIELMKDADPAVRYWAATGCSVRAGSANDAIEPLRKLLKDPAPCLRIAAAEALCRNDDSAHGLPTLVSELHGTEFNVLMALNALESLGSAAEPARQSIAAQLTTVPRPRGENYCAKAAESLLIRLGMPVPSLIRDEISPIRKR
jgi:N-sulfoglucosamine sulfohydrolase